MPTAKIAHDLDLHYLVDDYTDPWRESETILMLHGNAESGAVWFSWVPHLARQFRVVRPDQRGFGASTPMPRGFPWTLDIIIDDYVALMHTLGVARFHLVGAKLGGTIARRFAARFPELVSTLVLVGTPPPFRNVAARAPGRTHEFETHGVESWARRTMAGRLGSRFPAQGVEWWIKLMGRTPLSSEIGFVAIISSTDTMADLPKIACPTLVITSESSTQASVEQTRAWQQTIPRSALLVVPGDSYHVAASDGELCARETRDFISRAATM